MAIFADAKKSEQQAADFKNLNANDVVKLHPELAGAAAAVAVMDKQAEADGLNPQQRAVVAARIRQNVTNSIERGELPQVSVKETVEVKQEQKNDLSR